MSKYEVDVTEEKQYVHASLTGSGNDVNSLLVALGTITKYCHEHSIKKVLIEDYVVEEWSFHEMESLANQAMGFGFSGLQVAFYLHQHSRQFPVLFAGNIARDRGINVSIFVNLDWAKAWFQATEQV